MRRRRLRKLGFMDYDGDAMVLVNRRGEAYVVDDAVVYVWEAADGRTMSELEEIFGSRMRKRHRGAGEELRRLVRILMRCGLLKLSYR